MPKFTVRPFVGVVTGSENGDMFFENATLKDLGFSQETMESLGRCSSSVQEAGILTCQGVPDERFSGRKERSVVDCKKGSEWWVIEEDDEPIRLFFCEGNDLEYIRSILYSL